MPNEHLTACANCDLVMEKVNPPPGHHSKCPRCGSTVEYGAGLSRQAIKWLVAASAFFFIPSTFYPLLSLELTNATQRTSIFGGVAYLVEQSQFFSAGLVFFCSIFVPAAIIAAFIIVLFTPKRSSSHNWRVGSIRILMQLRTWAMLDVYLLGFFVSAIKLQDFGSIIPDIGLFALAGLTICFIKLFGSLDKQAMWDLMKSGDAGS